MFDLFGGGEAGATGVSVQAIVLPVIQETPQDYKEQLAWEKELLGMYVSDHPIARALDGMDLSGITPLGQLSDELVGKVLAFVGMLQGARRLATKKGDSMLVANLEDLETTAELVAFPKSYERYREILKDDALLRITAKVDKRNESLQLLLESAEALEATSAGAQAGQDAALEMDLEGLEAYIPPNSNGASMLGPQDEAPHPALASVPASTDRTDSRTDITETMSSSGSAASSNNTQRPSVKSASLSDTSVEPAPAESVSIIRSRVKAGGNGNGNGNSSTPPTAPPPSRQSLRLYLPRSHDFDADVRLMQMVDRVLRQNSGEDHVIIHMPNAVGTVLLKPRHTVRCSTELVGALQQVLGQDSVVVDG
jgi:DNA polymerase III subunit alpha